MGIRTTKQLKARPGDHAGPQSWGASHEHRGGFSHRGHRPAGLRRDMMLARFWLTDRCSPSRDHPARSICPDLARRHGKVAALPGRNHPRDLTPASHSDRARVEESSQ
jgi:hypothetical protein